jgi:hypothetical protein
VLGYRQGVTLAVHILILVRRSWFPDRCRVRTWTGPHQRPAGQISLVSEGGPTAGTISVMASWSEFVSAAPELARLVEERLAAGWYALLGTIRRDGFPRISGVVPHFVDLELLLAMRTDSSMAEDLRREPRCSLHSGPVEGGRVQSDAKVQSRAAEVDDPARIDGFLLSLGSTATSSTMTLFSLHPVDASTIRLGEGHRHLVDTWREGESGARSTAR